MTKTIKTLVISDAMMNEISGGRRLPVSKFAGIIEIKEQILYVNMLGRRCKGKRNYMPHSVEYPSKNGASLN